MDTWPKTHHRKSLGKMFVSRCYLPKKKKAQPFLRDGTVVVKTICPAISNPILEIWGFSILWLVGGVAIFVVVFVAVVVVVDCVFFVQPIVLVFVLLNLLFLLLLLLLLTYHLLFFWGVVLVLLLLVFL